MSDRDLDHLRQRLLEERERAIRSLSRFDERFRERMQESDGELSAYPQHMADEATDTMEREKDFLLASSEGRLLIAIDNALRTLYKEPDRFGRCESCGEEIAAERLDLIPWAPYCVRCQAGQEAPPG